MVNLSRQASASSQAILNALFCLAERRCMYFNSSPTCRWPTKWRATIREVEPYPKCQVTVNMLCSGDLKGLPSLQDLRTRFGREFKVLWGLGLESSGNQTYQSVWTRWADSAEPSVLFTGYYTLKANYLKCWSLSQSLLPSSQFH